MKSRFLVVITFLGFLLFLAACGPAIEADAADVDQVKDIDVADDENLDEDEGSPDPDDNMAGAHIVADEAASVTNPILATDESRATGETIFAASCAVCHGQKGRGDGPTAEAMEIKPADLTAGHVQELSDGALFYIITNGKPDTPMPAWQGVIEEEDRWNVVNYLRTLGRTLGRTLDGEDGEDELGKNEHSD